MDITNGSGKEVLINGFDVSEQEQEVVLDVLHRHQEENGNLELDKGSEME